MQIRLDDTVRETIYEETLPNGLKIHLLPKPGFAKKEIALTVAYGAVDREVLLANEPSPISFPDGTAHYLEHMLFESESENISNQFSATGSSVNAYTSPTRTSYFFSTTNGIEAPLDLLLNLVFYPKFTALHVEKERKIIAKEIQMYQDDLDQTIYEETLTSLFVQHPIRSDIAGTEASIAKIDMAWLNLAYETFYHPNNIHLVIVGDIDPEAIISLIKNHPFNDLRRENRLIRRIMHQETPLVRKAAVVKKKDIKTDMLMFGVKLDKSEPRTAFENDIDEIRLAFLFDNVFGKTSVAYRDLMNRRLINDTFEFSITTEEDYGFILIYTESKKPAAAKKAILGLLLSVIKNFSDEARFTTAKRKMLGNFIQTFDHISALAQFLTEYFVSGVDLFHLFQVVGDLTFAEIQQEIRQFDESSISVVHYHP